MSNVELISDKNLKLIEETNLILPDEITTNKEAKEWLNMVSKSCFFVYDYTDNKNENAKRHIYNELKEAGYKTNIEDYQVDYHRAIGEECVEVYVEGDFNIESFQGTTEESKLRRNKNGNNK